MKSRKKRKASEMQSINKEMKFPIGLPLPHSHPGLIICIVPYPSIPCNEYLGKIDWSQFTTYNGV